MDTFRGIFLSLTVILWSQFEVCDAYCVGYCGYSWWSMWYIWLVIVTLLLICCGAGGALWRRRHLANRQQTTTIVTASGQTTQPVSGPYGNQYGVVQAGQMQMMTPPAYNTVAGTGPGVTNMGFQPGVPP